MLDNSLLLDVFAGKEVARPPIWIMRQAGRILPEYRAIRSSVSGFKELVSTPSLAAEVTVQPVDRLGVDAAIIFSDILVIPECMGLDYTMVEKQGPFFPETIKNEGDIHKLRVGKDASENLQYVFDAVIETKKRLNNRVPLIGFSGAPWTLMCYMIEGKGSKTFSKAKAMLYREPKMAHLLLDKITETVIPYLLTKIEAGVDVVQIFDSWAGVLDQQLYKEFCIPYLNRIIKAIDGKVPTIAFSKGAYFSMGDIASSGCSAVGMDWSMPISEVRQTLGNTQILQGNMDPCVLYGDEKTIATTAVNTCKQFGRNHIFNLGHGVYPDTPMENVQFLVKTIRDYRYA